DRIVHAGALEDRVTGHLLLGFGVWAVADQQLSAAHLNPFRLACGPQHAAANQDAAGNHLLVPRLQRHVLVRALDHIALLIPHPGRWQEGKHHVLHGASPVIAITVVRGPQALATATTHGRTADGRTEPPESAAERHPASFD